MENKHIEISNKRGIPPKKDIFIDERKQLLQKLNDILGITDTNNVFYLYYLDKDLEKQQKIYELEKEVKIYFRCSEWTYFAKNTKKKYLSLIRSIYNDMNFNITRKATIIPIDNNIKIHTQKYFISPIDK